MSSLQTLLTEVLLKILSYLDRWDLMRLAASSKHFEQLIAREFPSSPALTMDTLFDGWSHIWENGFVGIGCVYFDPTQEFNRLVSTTRRTNIRVNLRLGTRDPPSPISPESFPEVLGKFSNIIDFLFSTSSEHRKVVRTYTCNPPSHEKFDEIVASVKQNSLAKAAGTTNETAHGAFEIRQLFWCRDSRTRDSAWKDSRLRSVGSPGEGAQSLSRVQTGFFSRAFFKKARKFAEKIDIRDTFSKLVHLCGPGMLVLVTPGCALWRVPEMEQNPGA
ncbi:hypothetical protein Ddc_15703 [Ditylenchus destructor]|nr:hypothetical protein Ddc_15703 [Ditylenchus destructor]